MIYLTLINSIVIIFILFKNKTLTLSIRRDETTWGKILTGYDVWFCKFYFRIPIRNKRKTELREDVNRMISLYDHQGKLQALSAMFSWLKTWDEVYQFEKDYLVVDRKIVENLVSNFKPKK